MKKKKNCHAEKKTYTQKKKIFNDDKMKEDVERRKKNRQAFRLLSQPIEN